MKKRVILLAPTQPASGGIATWTRRVLESGLPDGWEIALVDEKLIGKRENFGDHTGRKFHIEVIRCLRIWGGLLREMKNPASKVVHICIPSDLFAMMRETVSAWLAGLFHKPVIMHFRCTVPNMVQTDRALRVLRRLCRKCTCIFALNEQSAAFLRQHCTTPVIVIPNFVPEQETCANRQPREKIETAVYVGGVTAAKGCDVILDLAERCPAVRFRLVGAWENAIYERGKTLKNVVFTGALPHDRIMRELQDADVFLFLSRYRGEGFSNALAEAMAMALPCIVSDWAANRDMIGAEGGVVLQEPTAQCAQEALTKLESAELRDTMGERNRKTVLEKYSADAVLRQYTACYEELSAH